MLVVNKYPVYLTKTKTCKRVSFVFTYYLLKIASLMIIYPIIMSEKDEQCI